MKYLNITKEILNDLYTIQKKSIIKIAIEFNVNPKTISRYLKFFEIPISRNINCKGINNPFFGKHHTEEAKNKIRDFVITHPNKNFLKVPKLFGDKASNFKHGRYIENFCSDCNKKISPEAIRCKSCAHKGNLNTNFKGKKYYCLDCKKEISYTATRCKKCAKQGELNSQFGIKNPSASKRMKENNPSKKLENRIKISKRMSGINSPFFINGRGYEPYSSDFTEKLKELIRQRDNYICQGENCSMTEEEHIIVYGRVLEIHHIDHNKQNCNEDNLVTLCKQCNIRANKNINYWQDFYKNKIINKNKN